MGVCVNQRHGERLAAARVPIGLLCRDAGVWGVARSLVSLTIVHLSIVRCVYGVGRLLFIG